jgi:hypothetical protein
MDKLPQMVREFLQDGSRVEALFPNLSKEERYGQMCIFLNDELSTKLIRLTIHQWVIKGRHPLEHTSHNDPIQGRVLRLKKLTGIIARKRNDHNEGTLSSPFYLLASSLFFPLPPLLIPPLSFSPFPFYPIEDEKGN